MAVVGLITDFGDSVYDGIVESVIKSIDPSIDVIRVENSVPQFSVIAGSYIVYSSYRWLPKGSVITVVVDPGVGTRRRALVVRTNNYFFVAPDNGVIYEAAAEDGIREVYSIDYARVRKLASQYVSQFSTTPLSYTFHGRDIFAPAAALLAKGVSAADFAYRVNAQSISVLRLRQGYRVGSNGIRTRVVYIDRFGNVALGLTPREYRLPPVGRRVMATSKSSQAYFTSAHTFGDVKPGEPIAYINSFGFIELAVNQGSAAQLLKVNVGDDVTLSY